MANVIEFILKLTGKGASATVEGLKRSLEGSLAAAKGLDQALGGVARGVEQHGRNITGAALGALGAGIGGGLSPFNAPALGRAQAMIGRTAALGEALTGSPKFGAAAEATARAGAGVPFAAAEDAQAQLQALAAEYATHGAMLNSADLQEAGQALYEAATRRAKARKQASRALGAVLEKSNFSGTVTRGIAAASVEIPSQAIGILGDVQRAFSLSPESAQDLADRIARAMVGVGGRPASGIR